jgi:hypothetical protein
MSSTRDIPVSTDVFSAIWAARQPGEHSEDAILRRLLAVPAEASAPNQKPTAPRPILPVGGDDGELREAVNKLRLLPTRPNRRTPKSPPARPRASRVRKDGGIRSPTRWRTHSASSVNRDCLGNRLRGITRGKSLKSVDPSPLSAPSCFPKRTQTFPVLSKPAPRRPALEAAGVEFIDENGGGPGVRLRKPPKDKSRK